MHGRTLDIKTARTLQDVLVFKNGTQSLGRIMCYANA